MEKSQREYYLNEQVKAIQKELGEGEEEGADLDELDKKIKAAGMSKEGLASAERVEKVALNVTNVSRSHCGTKFYRNAGRPSLAQENPHQ